MTAEEVLAFCRQLPPTITRVERPYLVADGNGGWVSMTLIVEQAAPPVVRAAPEIGDVEKAARAKAAERPPSDVASLGHTPPEWKE